MEYDHICKALTKPGYIQIIEQKIFQIKLGGTKVMEVLKINTYKNALVFKSIKQYQVLHKKAK